MLSFGQQSEGHISAPKTNAVHARGANSPDSTESSLKINQSFHALTNKFENHPDYGNFFPIMLNVIINISLFVVQ